MSEGTISTIVVALFGLLGCAGFWQWLQSRKEAPIKKRDADIAVAHTSQQMALAIAEDLRLDVGRLRGDLDHERTQRENLGSEVKELRAKVDEQAGTIQYLRRVVQAFEDAWASLTANWHIVRLQETAPKQPKVNLKEEAR